MMTRGRALALLAILGLLALLPTTALAQRTLPHVFIGSATINGVPAPFGSVVAAWSDGVRLGGAVVRDGRYSLLVEAPPAGDRSITFTVGDIVASQKAAWRRGEATVLNLTATAEADRSQPPHVFVGAATIDGARAANGTVVRAWAHGLLMGTAVVGDGRYTLTVAKPAGDNAITFTIGELVTSQRAGWVKGGADILNLAAGSATTPTRVAIEPLGDNLVRMFHYDHTSGGWTFYDPRPAFAEGNSLDSVVPGQQYLLQLFDDQVLTLNSAQRSLSTGMNRITW